MLDSTALLTEPLAGNTNLCSLARVSSLPATFDITIRPTYLHIPSLRYLSILPSTSSTNHLTSLSLDASLFLILLEPRQSSLQVATPILPERRSQGIAPAANSFPARYLAGIR